jgi:hypothetical protein
MKNTWLIAFLLLSLSLSTVSLSGCSAGGHIGPIGGSASVS